MDNPAKLRQSRCMADKRDILIVGGGLNGATLALALAQAGFGVTVIDAQTAETHKNPDFDGRSYALALTSKRLLVAIGIWDALADLAQPMLKIVVSDGRAGEGASPLHMVFDSHEIEEGPMGFMIEDRHLRPALITAMENTAKITHMPGNTVISQTVTPGGVSVTLASGVEISGAILIGADGRASATAQRAGIHRQGHDYHQTGLVCAVAHEQPHLGTAHQFFMPGGPLAILPLKGNRSSIVWSEETGKATQLAALDDEAFLNALRPVFGSFLGEISLAGARFAYPLTLTLADRFTADRLALVGDAAHGIHPIAGQGLNAGLRDVAAIVDVLRDAKQRGEDPGAADVLGRYARWRRFDLATMVAATDGVNMLFSNDNNLLRGLRDIGLAMVNATPTLRRAFIREAAGLSGELPSLML